MEQERQNATAAKARRVLVTRAAEGASALVDELKKLGLDALSVAAIKIVEPSSFDALDRALGKLEHFDWLLFTSATAVGVFAKRHPPEQSASMPRIAAIGSATARAVEACGLHVDLVPATAVAESLLEALLPYTRRANGAPARLLLVRAEEARELLPESLRSAGAEVVVAPAYRTVVPEESVAAIQQLLSDPRTYPDAVTFTSASTARNLLALCEAADVALPPEVLRVSIGPITSETLRVLGIPPHAEASEATVQALAQAVRKSLDEVSDG